MDDDCAARDDGASTARDWEGLRVGVDLVAISKIRQAVALHGERYVRRVFTDHEVAVCTSPSGGYRFDSLAARFAAKEATVKALQPDDIGFNWRDVEVRSLENGACTLQLHGAVAELAADVGVGKLAVSMSHEGDMAAAVVIAWSPPPLHLCPADQRSEHCRADVL